MHVYSNYFFFLRNKRKCKVSENHLQNHLLQEQTLNLKGREPITKIVSPSFLFLTNSNGVEYPFDQFEAAVPDVPPPNLITIPPQGGEKIRDGKREESNFASFAHQQPVLVCQHFYALIQAQFHKVCCEES